MPFLVDSVAASIAAHGLSIDLIVHPILPVRRDAQGRITALPEGEGDGEGEKRESMIYLETARVDARERRALEAELKSAIADTRAANADWPRLKQVIGEDADRLADSEGAALLRWLGDGMMTHLGHVTKQRGGGLSDLLGICRKSARDLLSEGAYEAAFAWFDGGPGAGRGKEPGRAPLIIKANRLSRVHRRSTCSSCRSTRMGAWPRSRSMRACGPARRCPPRRRMCRCCASSWRRSPSGSSSILPGTTRNR
jgi:glutamate dehydrogenase